MNNIENLLNDLNEWKTCGSVDVLSDDDSRKGCGFEELEDDDIVIFYDWNDDELSENEVNEFAEWLYDRKPNFFQQLHTEMNKLGYAGVYENDGSGGGLYYGCEVFRKI